MNKRQVAFASILIPSLLAVMVIAFHQFPEPKPPRKSYSLRIWGEINAPANVPYGKVWHRSKTVWFSIENLGDNDVHGISLKHAGTDVWFAGNVSAGAMEIFLLTDFPLFTPSWQPEGVVCAQIDFECNELPKNRTYNAAALGVIFFELYWQPGETVSQKYAFSF